MREPNFNPSTWILGDFTTYDKRIPIRTVDSSAPIAWVDNDDVDPHEAKANANLIVTSPHMYRELEDLLTIDNGWTPKSWEIRSRMIRRLLARARGEL